MVEYEARLDNPRRCVAHRQRDGEPCGRWAIQGGNVCAIHGGKAPQVLAKARERIVLAADNMAEELLKIAMDGSSEAVKLAAVKDALDRAGLSAKNEVSVELKPWERLMSDITGIATISRAEHLANQRAPIIDAELVEPDGPVDPPSAPPPNRLMTSEETVEGMRFSQG
jgi:hypothetical protein